MKRILSILLVTVMLVFCFVGCANSGDKKLVVAASSTPHAEILEKCVPLMKDRGFELEVKVMDDYITPNNAVENGDVTANYFQHEPYLINFNKEHGTHLEAVMKVHYEPYAIYMGTKEKIEDLVDGDKIAVPNDATNEARALQLLAASGIITLNEDAGLTATVGDIVENLKGVEIVEMEAALVPSVLDEVAFGVVNGNYALNSGLDITNAVATEDPDSEAAQTYANILVVKTGNGDSEAVKALIECLSDKSIKDYITEYYGGAVVPLT